MSREALHFYRVTSEHRLRESASRTSLNFWQLWVESFTLWLFSQADHAWRHESELTAKSALVSSAGEKHWPHQSNTSARSFFGGLQLLRKLYWLHISEIYFLYIKLMPREHVSCQGRWRLPGPQTKPRPRNSPSKGSGTTEELAQLDPHLIPVAPWGCPTSCCRPFWTEAPFICPVPAQEVLTQFK